MYARIVGGQVAELTEDMPELAPGECALIVEAGTEVQVGWLWTPQGCVPPQEPQPDPKAVAYSYLLADAQTLDDLRDAVAVITGVGL